MNKQKVFCVYYQTMHSKGYIKVYVDKFFSEQPQTNINKLLKLARTYCTSSQQATLLQDLEEVKQNIKLITRRKRIEWCINKVKTQVWGQGKKS